MIARATYQLSKYECALTRVRVQTREKDLPVNWFLVQNT